MRSLSRYVEMYRKWRSSLPPSLNSISSVRLKSTDEVKWLWRANSEIEEFHRANCQGTRIGIFVLTLNSVKPLEHIHFTQALEHFQRTVPHSKICLRTHGDELWYCHAANLREDFQILDEGTNTREAILGLIEGKFQSTDTSPLCGRVIPRPNDSACVIPEVKSSHPHQYDLIFTGPHGIVDGLGGAVCMKFLVQLLNSVAAGNPIDEEDLGPYYEDNEIPELLHKTKEKLRNDSNFAEAVARTRLSAGHIPLFFQAFPRPDESKVTTKHICRVLDSETLKIFNSRSKSEGVTFNSALVCVINTALMELIKEKGINQDAYRISANILSTLRRYMKPSSKFYLGPSGAVMSYTSSVDKDVRENFWGYCRKVNSELQSSLEQGLPLHQKALQEITDADQPPFDYVTRFRPAVHDYSITNLGDVSVLFSGCGDFVKVTNITSMNMIHNSFNSSFHEVLTFNNRIYYTLGYATNYFSDETASLVLNKIFSILEDLAKPMCKL